MTDEEEQFAQQWYERKSAFMEEVLGPEYEMVMHAIIPYAIGGGLDLYYFPNGIEGTAIATKELSEAPDEGSSNEVFRSYELVMFTRHPVDLEDVHNQATPFGQVHAILNSILNTMAPYSAQTTLNPCETCEFPADMERIGGKCLIFDAYPQSFNEDEQKEFGLLALIEVFRSEMEFAREHGGAILLERLKDAGHYPYSDLDRDPVA